MLSVKSKKMKKVTSLYQLFLISCICILLLVTSGCVSSGDSQKRETDREQINVLLDQFNEAAANADFQKYFDFFTEDAVFIGTDATENWNKKEFMTWAKPHFDNKKTWHFKSINRHLYFYDSDGYREGNLAWFDELLDTQMKICRGSGVLIKHGEQWKIQQYVLSMTIPNSLMDSVMKIKSSTEEKLLKKFRSSSH